MKNGPIISKYSLNKHIQTYTVFFFCPFSSLINAMRDIPTSIAELQLSSPLPSPDQHNIATTNNTFSHTTHTPTPTTTTTTTLLASHSTTTYTLPSLHCDIKPHELYPLSSLETPSHLKRINFEMNGNPCIFEETNVSFPHILTSFYPFSHTIYE